MNNVQCTGTLRIFSRLPGESWTLRLTKKNKVVNVGLALIADRLKDNTANALSHIAIGTGTTPVSAVDTTLQTEIFRQAISLVNTPGAQLTAETTIGPGDANTTWEEVAIFNNAVAGTMYNRINVTFTKNIGEEVKTEFTLDFTATT